MPRSCRTCKSPQRQSTSACALCKTRSSSASSSVALVAAAGAAMWCMTLRWLGADSPWSGLSAVEPHKAQQPAQSWRSCQKFPPPKSALSRLLSSGRLPTELQMQAVPSLRPPTLRCSVPVRATLHQAVPLTGTHRGTVGLGIQPRPRCKLSTVLVVLAYPRRIHHCNSQVSAKTELPCCLCRWPLQSLQHGHNLSRTFLTEELHPLKQLRTSLASVRGQLRSRRRFMSLRWSDSFGRCSHR